MSVQFAPAESQRRHCRLNEVGLFDHVPGSDVKVRPGLVQFAAQAPAVVSAGETVGAPRPAGARMPITVAVGCESAELEPETFVAVTRTRSDEPTSPGATV